MANDTAKRIHAELDSTSYIVTHLINRKIFLVFMSLILLLDCIINLNV